MKATIKPMSAILVDGDVYPVPQSIIVLPALTLSYSVVTVSKNVPSAIMKAPHSFVCPAFFLAFSALIASIANIAAINTSSSYQPVLFHVPLLNGPFPNSIYVLILVHYITT